MTAGQCRIRDLELVVTLHEEGNMTQAAKRLGMSEPALSKQLQKIEYRITAHIGKEQLVVSRALGAIDAASGGGDKLRVTFVERCLLQEQKDVMLYPLLQVPNREQNALGLSSGSAPFLAKTVGESLFLLRGL